MKIAVNFPDEVYNKIDRRARTKKTSFSAMAVELVKCGLFDFEESEKHEPRESRSHQKLGPNHRT
jgi:hypothetical protein